MPDVLIASRAQELTQQDRCWETRPRCGRFIVGDDTEGRVIHGSRASQPRARASFALLGRRRGTDGTRRGDETEDASPHAPARRSEAGERGAVIEVWSSGPVHPLTAACELPRRPAARGERGSRLCRRAPAGREPSERQDRGSDQPVVCDRRPSRGDTRPVAPPRPVMTTPSPDRRVEEPGNAKTMAWQCVDNVRYLRIPRVSARTAPGRLARRLRRDSLHHGISA